MGSRAAGLGLVRGRDSRQAADPQPAQAPWTPGRPGPARPARLPHLVPKVLQVHQHRRVLHLGRHDVRQWRFLPLPACALACRRGPEPLPAGHHRTIHRPVVSLGAARGEVQLLGGGRVDEAGDAGACEAHGRLALHTHRRAHAWRAGTQEGMEGIEGWSVVPRRR